MQLGGMLDSPYVLCVAISLQLLGLRFEHRPGFRANITRVEGSQRLHTPTGRHHHVD